MGSALFIYENEWMPNYWITYYPVSQVRYLTSTLIRYLFITIVPLSWLAFEAANIKEENNQTRAHPKEGARSNMKLPKGT